MVLPFFYSPEEFNEDQAWLDEANSKHAIAVLRMQAGEHLHITDGRGLLLTASITAPHKKKCAIKILQKELSSAPQTRVCIAISPVKNASRFEWFLEKATEIGVTEIIPLLCQRTEKNHFKTERFEQIIVSAMLQSQQVFKPLLTTPKSFQETIQVTGFQKKWIAHCLPNDRLSLRTQAVSIPAQILLIGPEGDFTASEIEQAIEEQFVPVTLGQHRLRTETAGVVGASLLCIS
jgi:16S rRNA (uracil1498-N3)-methyltransferase